jgi:tetratricopeptide (TPR) repeat protein
MSRVRFATLLLFSIVTLPLLGQKATVVTPFDGLVTDNVVQTPEQLRRVPPPPDDLTAAELETRADQLRFEKNYADSLDYYHAAMKKQESATLHNKAGIAELQMLRYDEAKKSFERAVKLDSKYADAHNNLGVIHYVKRNYRRAVKSYSKAIKLHDDSASYHSNLGTALFARQDFGKAAQEYMRAMELDPEIFDRTSQNGVSAKLGSPADRAHYNYVIAKTFASRGDTEHCLLYLRKAMEDGFPGINDVYKEAAFAAVRRDPRFVALMESKPLAIN